MVKGHGGGRATDKDHDWWRPMVGEGPWMVKDHGWWRTMEGEEPRMVKDHGWWRLVIVCTLTVALQTPCTVELHFTLWHSQTVFCVIMQSISKMKTLKHQHYTRQSSDSLLDLVKLHGHINALTIEGELGQSSSPRCRSLWTSRCKRDKTEALGGHLNATSQWAERIQAVYNACMHRHFQLVPPCTAVFLCSVYKLHVPVSPIHLYTVKCFWWTNSAAVSKQPAQNEKKGKHLATHLMLFCEINLGE